MFKRVAQRANRTGGFLTRLARDTRGNALIIMTLMLIPVAGMVGGGVDISRMYILKTRLQHACDAGALAGRRAMGGGTWGYNNYYSRTQANLFFDNNFDWEQTGNKPGEYGSYNVERTFAENAGKVTGQVKATIPMTLMKIFRQADQELTVECDAEMRLPNTDVMFVLDTTGSMDQPQPGDTVNKMDALKVAVKCFYEIVARLDTNAACTTGNPSGGTGNQVQIRFGFVPYATNVNVGYLLKPEWFADSWKYQTREPKFNGGWVVTGTPTAQVENISMTNVPAWQCNDATARQLDSSSEQVNGNSKSVTQITHDADSWSAANNGTCSGKRTTTRTQYVWDAKAGFTGWRYAQLDVNVGLLKSGGTWKRDFKWPIGAGGSDATIGWDGCVEERQTTRATDYDPIPTAAKDLNIDAVPTAGDPTTQWGMVLPRLHYTRDRYKDPITNLTVGVWDRNPSEVTNTEFVNEAYYACPMEARKLQQWTDASTFDAYVDQLRPEGNTYHDIGLIWGARLMSPTGLFKAENEFTPKGGEIERHLIFMTDGDACTSPDNYTAYGVEWFDRRRTNEAVAPTGGCTFNAFSMTEQVNKRTEGLCEAIKQKKIELWVIAFGNLHTETETRLKNCASSSRYYKATSASELQKTFKSIADQISMLRLTN